MLNPLDRSHPKDIGDRLRAARSRAGLTQQEAARDLKMARTTLLAIEKGERRIRTEEFRAMAALYRLSVNSFFQLESGAPEFVPRFRALSSTADQAGADAARLLNELVVGELELERALGVSFRPNYPAERPIGTGDVREIAEEAALETRQRLGLGLGPLNDLVSLLELEVGIRIFVRPLPSGSISGLFAFDDTAGACMLLNQNHPRERRALTAAHEYGHFLSSRRQPDVLDLTRSTQSREEKFATAFSVALMMPSASIRRRFEDLKREAGRFSPRHLIILAHHFCVSEEAFCRRLEELSLVRGGTWESLRDRGFSGELVRQVLGDTPSSLGPVVPPRSWVLAVEAYRREILTEGQIARRLCMDRVAVRRMIDSLGAEGNDDLESVETE